MADHSNRTDYAIALRMAKSQGMNGELHRVEDDEGGYWQCATPYGPYNFRVRSTREVAR